jgi:membrane-associated phospholipid phosphatase
MYQVFLLIAMQGASTLPFQLAVPAQKADVVFTWNNVALEVFKVEDTPPPLVTRNLAIMHAAMYDAINSIVPTYSPYRYAAENSHGASPVVAGAIAAHRVLVDLHPRQVARFNAILDDCLELIPESPAKAAGVALGQAVAEKMLAWRRTDGSTRPVTFPPGRMVGQWQSTPPEYRPALLPQWTRLTCFCMPDGAQFRPAAPPELTSAAYGRSLNQVKALGATLTTARTPDQTEIAWFWIDGAGTVTPPGHWNRIAQTVAKTRGTTLEENARLFALLNLAMADAAIAAWDCKYHYNFWRPVTAIRYAGLVGNPANEPDPDWTPLLPTPPFPSYTSGHSTFSGAGAGVLAYYFGTDAVAFSSGSDTLPGIVRSYPGFWAAAREAGMSRIYGGIHYDFDNEAGLAAGRAVGDYVCRHFLLPTTQTASSPFTSTFAIRRR